MSLKMDYPNIVFIVVDSLRKDYAKPLERELKKLGFISYENAIAPASWTLPSHASMLTGLYTLVHRAHETKTKKCHEIKLSANEMLLTYELKSKYNYTNYLLTPNMFLSPYFGFKGFDKYLIIPTQNRLLSQKELDYIKKLLLSKKSKMRVSLKLIKDKKFILLSKAILTYFKNRIDPILGLSDWPLDKGIKNALKIVKSMNFNKPAFVFMNIMEVHQPYTLKEPSSVKLYWENFRTNKLNMEIVKKWRENYPKEVDYVTKKIIELMVIFKEKGMFDNSLIIITSDHGQLLGEHGRIGHGTFLYDELLRVPLLIKYPKNYGIRHEIPKETKYISLTKLKPYILGILDGKIVSDSVLYEDIVFSESYGIPEPKPKDIIKQSDLTEQEKQNIEKLEKYRITIYYRNFKGIFNVTDWKFEEIISYNPKIEITKDIVELMKKEIMKFLKTATITKVSKIKL